MTLTIDGHQGREQNTPNTGKNNMQQVWRRETQPDQKTERERAQKHLKENCLYMQSDNVFYLQKQWML